MLSKTTIAGGKFILWLAFYFFASMGIVTTVFYFFNLFEKRALMVDILTLVLWFILALILHSFLIKKAFNRYNVNWNIILLIANIIICLLTVISLYLGSSDVAFDTDFIEMTLFAMILYFIALPVYLNYLLADRLDNNKKS